MFFGAFKRAEALRMEIHVRIILDDGTEHSIVGISREDWSGLGDPCPECGHREFNHFTSAGGLYGPYQGAVVERSDFWDANRPLFTRCRSCREILYQHPAFELLYPVGDRGEPLIKM